MPSSELTTAIGGNQTAAGGEQFDWQWLVSQTVHPVKVAIVEALMWIGRPVTSNDLFNSFDRPGSIGNVSYHVNELARMEVLYVVERRAMRGLKERYFFFASSRLCVPA